MPAAPAPARPHHLHARRAKAPWKSLQSWQSLSARPSSGVEGCSLRRRQQQQQQQAKASKPARRVSPALRHPCACMCVCYTGFDVSSMLTQMKLSLMQRRTIYRQPVSPGALPPGQTGALGSPRSVCRHCLSIVEATTASMDPRRRLATMRLRCEDSEDVLRAEGLDSSHAVRNERSLGMHKQHTPTVGGCEDDSQGEEAPFFPGSGLRQLSSTANGRLVLARAVVLAAWSRLSRPHPLPAAVTGRLVLCKPSDPRAAHEKAENNCSCHHVEICQKLLTHRRPADALDAWRRAGPGTIQRPPAALITPSALGPTRAADNIMPR